MRTSYIIIILGVTIASSVIFAVSQDVLQEQNLSKQCDIPFDENFLKRRAYSAPNDGKPHHTIEAEFSIYRTVPIGEFRVDEFSHSLILKPVVTSHGYIIMCDPLPILEKRFGAQIDGLVILVDDKEIEYKIINNVLKINVNNNTRIEIVGIDKD
ncbi:MAG: hypothetical protein OEL84_06875 [Nitrosopumilus sp.]|nr:hypothetical protein [Nitrosopumilus sp.]